jgi:hypothetical protein
MRVFHDWFSLFQKLLSKGLVLKLGITSRLYAPGRGFQTSCDFISLNAWYWVKQDPQYAVDATAGVYSFVVWRVLIVMWAFGKFFHPFNKVFKWNIII